MAASETVPVVQDAELQAPEELQQQAELLAQTLSDDTVEVLPPAAPLQSGSRPFRPLEPAPQHRRPQRSNSRGKNQLNAPPSSPSKTMPTILGRCNPSAGGYAVKPQALDSPPKSSAGHAQALESLPQTPSTAASGLTPPCTPSPPSIGVMMVGSPCRALRKRSESTESAARLRRPSRPSTLDPLPGFAHVGPPIRLSPSMAMSWRADKALFVDTFNAFCSSTIGLNASEFVMLCKHCFLFDAHFTSSDAEQLFREIVQDGSSEMALPQFEAALYHVAKQKGIPFDTVRRAVTITGGPSLQAVCNAAGLLAPGADKTAAMEVAEKQHAAGIKPEVLDTM